MRSEQALREELKFVEEFRVMLDVMQQVAVSHLRRLEGYERPTESLVERLEREWVPLLPQTAAREPLLSEGPNGAIIVALTSEEGLVGPLHAEVMRQARARADERTGWIIMGQRGRRLLGGAWKNLEGFPVPAEDAVGPVIAQLSRTLLARYLREQRQAVWLIAPRFVSMTRQDVVVQQLLPLPLLLRSPASLQLRSDEDDEVMLEPSAARVVERLAQLWVEHVCLEAFWSARRAEFSARALHVESCRQELAKQAKGVQHEFFKSLHERVDRQVRETCVVQRQM